MRVENRGALIEPREPNRLRAHIEHLKKLAVPIAPFNRGTGTEHGVDLSALRIVTIRPGETSAEPMLVRNETAPVQDHFARNRFDMPQE
jgi:hypothetical protein